MSIPTKILLIENDPVYADLVRRLLYEGSDTHTFLEHVSSIEGAAGVLETGSFDLVLIDVSDTTRDGLKDIERLLELAPDSHIVVLAHERHEDLAVEAVRLGAQDFLVKREISFRQLSRAVRFAMERGRNLARLSARAFHDDLTGLERRASVLKKLEVAIAGADRRERVVGVVYVDLDGFKAINDHHGHLTGDRVLEEVARRLQAVVRRADTVGRIGGDEFVVVVTDLPSSDYLPPVVEKIRSSFESEMQLDELCLNVAASVGWALAEIQDIDNLDRLIARADAMMYEEKARRAGFRHSATRPRTVDEVE